MAGDLKTRVGPSDDLLSEEGKEQLKTASNQIKSDTGNALSEPLSSDEIDGGANEERNLSENFDLKQASMAAKAVDKVLEDDICRTSDSENPFQIFSQDYEARKQKILQTAFDDAGKDSGKKSSGRRKHFFRYPAVAAAAVLIIVLGVGASDADAMPESIRQFVMHVRSVFSSAIIEDFTRYGANQASDFLDEILTVYEPTLVLDGYEAGEVVLQTKMYEIQYKNPNGEEYRFQQRPIDFVATYNSEDVVYEDVTVGNAHTGITYVKNGQRHLQWQQDSYVMELVGGQSLETLEMLGASVKAAEENQE